MPREPTTGPAPECPPAPGSMPPPPQTLHLPRTQLAGGGQSAVPARAARPTPGSAAEDTGMTTQLAQLTPGALAQLLFACPLQPSARPSAPAIQAALAEQYQTCHGNLARCLEVIAQEAGDQPDLYTERMHWALHCIASLTPPGFGGGQRGRAQAAQNVVAPSGGSAPPRCLADLKPGLNLSP